MSFLIAISLIPLIGVLIYALVLFDRLLRAEYEGHRSTWLTDGKPSGFFWRARECDLITSPFARTRLSFIWLFLTPDWVARSAHLTSTLRRHRYAVLIWNMGVIMLFAMSLAVVMY
jgi:amino acid transporter